MLECHPWGEVMKKGIIITLLGGTFWGIFGTMGQFLFQTYHLNTMWLTTLRMIFAGIILLSVCFIKDTKKTLSIWNNKNDVFQLVLFALLGLMFCQYSYMTAIYYSNSSTAAILQYLNPIFIMFYTCLVCKRLPYKKELLCVALAFGGTFILATHGNIHEMILSFEGLFWGVMAGLAASFYSLLPRHIMNKYGSLIPTGYAMIIGGVVLGIIGRVWNISASLDIYGYLAMAGIIIIGTVLAFSMYLIGVNLIGPMRASLIAAVEPLSATICMCLWLHSPFTLMDVLGFIMVMSTIFILSYKKKAS